MAQTGPIGVCLEGLPACGLMREFRVLSPLIGWPIAIETVVSKNVIKDYEQC